MDYSENIWSRGRRDGITAAKSSPFVVAEVGGTALIGVLSQNPWFAVVWFFGLLFALFIGATASAPFRQRNDARRDSLAMQGKMQDIQCDKPDLKVQIKNVIYGEKISDSSIFFCLGAITITNVGTMPSVFEVDSLKISIDGECLRFNPIRSNIAIVGGASVELLQINSIYAKTDISIPRGGRVKCHLATELFVDRHVGGKTITAELMINDVLGGLSMTTWSSIDQ